MNDLMHSTWLRGRAFLSRFARDDKGAALAEYAAIFIVVAIAGTGFLVVIGDSLVDAGTAIDTFIQDEIVTPLTD